MMQETLSDFNKKVRGIISLSGNTVFAYFSYNRGKNKYFCFPINAKSVHTTFAWNCNHCNHEDVLK